MFNILIVAHGNLAEELMNSSKMIVGEQDGIYALGLQSNEGIDEFGTRIDNLFRQIYSDNGVLILADLFGGTPCNTVILKILSKFDRVEMITGANLSMVIEATANRNATLKGAVDLLKDVGINDICNMREKLKEEVEEDALSE
jgi:PTS system mannose-specific IIA component